MPPTNWVNPLKDMLSRNGISIDDTVLSRNRNVFLAGWRGRAKRIVAASSTQIGFWGIQKKVVSAPELRGHEWGALFLDIRSSKCFWVDAPNVTRVSDSSSADEYLFRASVLEENQKLVHKINVDVTDEGELARNFLSLVGLEADE
jgi:hypothetical protein